MPNNEIVPKKFVFKEILSNNEIVPRGFVFKVIVPNEIVPKEFVFKILYKKFVQSFDPMCSCPRG